MGKKGADLTGQKFGRLTVVERSCDKIKRDRLWICRCDCGNYSMVLGYHLKSGHTKSCGCLSPETTAKNHKKHGLYYTRLHTTWVNMKSRCYNCKDERYSSYGERGIAVCDEWRDNLNEFYNWAMANGYSDDLTIDRIDVNGDYCPENCRWIPMAEQSRNRRINRFLTHNGKTMLISDWAKETGIGRTTIDARLKRGWSVEKTLNTPTK